MTKTVLLIGAGHGSPDVVSRLKSLGLTIILVELKHMFDPQRTAEADEIIITDYRKEGFIDFAIRLRTIWHYDAVLSITEFGVITAARLNQRLGLRGSDEQSVLRLNNKAAMRSAMQERGFAPLAYKLLRQREDIDAFAQEANWPLILKPVDGGGSHGIHLAHVKEEAQAAFDSLTTQGLTVLAEEYIDGREYSVESFTFDSKHHVIAITEKLINEQFVEIGHVVPARLTESAASEVIRFICAFLDLIGITNGPCHTEMKISSKGMQIIESHNRLGGGNIPRLVYLVYGIDMIKLAGQWACGMVGSSLPRHPPKGAAAIHFFVFPPGEICHIDGLDALAHHLGEITYKCLYQKGDTVPAMLNNGGRAGYVIVHENAAETALSTASRLAGGVVATCKNRIEAQQQP